MLLPLLVFSFSALAGSSEAENIIYFLLQKISGNLANVFVSFGGGHTESLTRLCQCGEEGSGDAEKGGGRGNQLESA